MPKISASTSDCTGPQENKVEKRIAFGQRLNMLQASEGVEPVRINPFTLLNLPIVLRLQAGCQTLQLQALHPYEKECHDVGDAKRERTTMLLVA